MVKVKGVFFSIILFLTVGFISFSQEKNNKKFEFYGFIRADLFTDSYKGLNSASDQFYLFPLYAGKDAQGQQINSQQSADLVLMGTRVGMKAYGPDLLGAKTVANIEGDFAGHPSSLTGIIRLRQANVKFNWEKSVLTVGQTWHPMWAGQIYPTVGSLNTGAPFQPFNRSPQIRYDYTYKALTVSAAGISEFQYLSYGPDGKTDQYHRNAVMPEVFTGAEISKGIGTLGAGMSYKIIHPQVTTINNYVAKNTEHSMIFMAYGQIKTGNLTLKAKSTIGENTSYLLIPGGYGVSAIDDITGDYTYTNYKSSAHFINAVYGKVWQVGGFAGYFLNMGTRKPLVNTGSEENPVYSWGLKPEIQSMYRLSGHLARNYRNLRIILEFEHTRAKYGIEGFNSSDGLYSVTDGAINNRFLMVVYYYF
ncbi:hypothetical protein ACE1ET_03385 [Saccharicrinis sp. FJH62]|uniref:hypothetical protein n=1 Tax=Saccharicrinis sp. FJH62 TaxID=3344657 RepID=UPI0035D4FD35